MVELAGRNAIVTGAAVGLGKCYAEALAREGVNVAVCDLRDEVHDVANHLKTLGVNAVSWQGNVADWLRTGTGSGRKTWFQCRSNRAGVQYHGQSKSFRA